MKHSQVFAVIAVTQALLYVGGADKWMGGLAAIALLVMVLAAMMERRDVE